MNILTIDFETFYDRSYSLSKITTEEYIRDDLFDAIGVAVKRNDEPAIWFSGPKRETIGINGLQPMGKAHELH